MTPRALSSGRASTRAPKGLFGGSNYFSQLSADIDRALAAGAAELAKTRAQVDAVIARGRAARAGRPNLAAERTRAAASGAADALTVGLADPASAALRAGFGEGFRRRFDSALQREREQDRLDAQQYPVSRAFGQTAGTVGGVVGLAALGPLGAAGAAASRAGAVARIGGGAGHVARVGAAVGGSLGAVGQAGSDLLSGRVSPIQDYAGSVAGGIVGGAAIPYAGAVPAAALTGLAIPTSRAALGGKPVTPDELSSSVMQHALVGKVVGDAALALFRNQGIRTKGKVGEVLSAIDSYLVGDPVVKSQRKVAIPSGSYTIADHLTRRRVIESKAGDGARLTANQIRAQAELPNFLAQHWTTRDLRGLASVGAASHSADAHRRPGRQ